MFRFLAPFVAAALLASTAGVPLAHAEGSRDDQGAARKGVKEGAVLPLKEIERRIVPSMQADGMEYLGPAYDSVAKAYRLKFIKNGRVTFVDVDARSGQVLSRSR